MKERFYDLHYCGKQTMTLDLKYSHIFDDHMEIAKQRFIEKNGRSPTMDEQIDEYYRLMEYFYE